MVELYTTGLIRITSEQGLPARSLYRDLRRVLAAVPCGLRLTHSTNLSTSGWAFRASSVLYSRSSSLLGIATCTCRWQEEHRSTVRWTSRRSNVFLFRLFLWRVLGTRWCRVSLWTIRPQSPHAPPFTSPFVLLLTLFIVASPRGRRVSAVPLRARRRDRYNQGYPSPSPKENHGPPRARGGTWALRPLQISRRASSRSRSLSTRPRTASLMRPSSLSWISASRSTLRSSRLRRWYASERSS